MKALFTKLLVIYWLLCSGMALAATSLSDSALARISGGGVDQHLGGQNGGQNLPQDQQQPVNNNAYDTLPKQPKNYLPPRQSPSKDGMDLTPELFAILQSSIDVVRDRKVLLNGSTQQNAKAINLENVISSDITATNNIFNGGNLSIDDLTTGIEIHQLNELHQLHRRQGSLHSFFAGNRYEKSIDRQSGSESFDYHVYANIYQQRRSGILRIDSGESSVQVGDRYASLEEFLADALPIHLITPPELGTFFKIEIIDGLGYSGVTFTGVGLDLDSIRAGGYLNNDLVLGTHLILPIVDFGTIYNLWPVPDIELGKLGGNTIDLFDITIPGLGPRIEELNLGAGFALNGNGALTLVESGAFTIDGEVALKVTPFATLVLDLRETALKAGPWRQDWRFDLINEKIVFTLLDEEFDDSLFNTTPGFLTGSPSETISEDNDTIIETKLVDVAESAHNTYYEHSVLTGGRMTGAEAELLALSEGTLSVANNSIISLSEGAQQNMRVFNSVNAASSVAANALNISMSPVASAGSSPVSQISMQQHNRFIQQR